MDANANCRLERASALGELTSWQVTAYITAYADSSALNRCLAGIRAQTYPIQHILIVDNSPTPLAIAPEHAADPRLRIWHHPENLGISGGLALAAKFATQAAVDFLWLFDQDSYPAADCLHILVMTYQTYTKQGDQVGIVAPTAVDSRTGEVVRAGRFLGDRFRGFPPPPGDTPYDCDVAITSGSLLRLETLEQVALPDPRLFIDGIDLDHGLRLRQAGYRNLVVPTAQMTHRFGQPITIQFCGQKKNLQLYSPLRHYYICRNHTYLELRHSQGFAQFTCGLHRLRYLLVSSVYILLFDRQSTWQTKRQKILACFLGTWHGWLGKLDPQWQDQPQ